METLQSSFVALEKAVGENSKKGSKLQNELMQLSSISRLLSLSSIPSATAIRLSSLLRQTLCRFYPDFLLQSLPYALNIFQYFHKCGSQPAPGLQAAIISGILDFMEESPSANIQTTVADLVYPVFCHLYLDKAAVHHLWTLDRGLAVTIFQMLHAVTTGNGTTASQLRQRIGGSRLGEIISKVQDFLVLEAALMLFGYLTPPLKKGREARSAFIDEVFDQSMFPAYKRITTLAESAPPEKWDDTLTKIVAIMAESDLSLPQPFDVTKIKINGTSMSVEPPIYIDKQGICGSYELKDGSLDTFEIPFPALKRVRCNVEKSNGIVQLELSQSIVVGGNQVEIGTKSDAKAPISFTVITARLSYLMNALRQRKVNVQLGQHKISTAGKEINLDIPLVREDSKARTQQRIEKFTQAHLQPSTPSSRDKADSPPSVTEIFSSPALQEKCPIVTPANPVPTTSTPVISISSEYEDIKPAKSRFKVVPTRKRVIDISEDEESYVPTQALVSAPEPASPKKRRVTRARTAKGNQPAVELKTNSPVKRKRMLNWDSESELTNVSDVQDELTLSPPTARKGPIKTYKKAKTTPASPFSSAIDFDELPKSKKPPAKKKVAAKSKPQAKIERPHRAVKKDAKDAPKPKARATNKKSEVETKVPKEEVRSVNNSDDVVEEGPTLVEIVDPRPGHPAKPPVKPVIQRSSSPPPAPRKKQQKAPWEDMTVFYATSEQDIAQKTSEFSPHCRSDTGVEQSCSDDSKSVNHSIVGGRFVDFTVPMQQGSSSTDTDVKMADKTMVDTEPEHVPAKRIAFGNTTSTSSPAPLPVVKAHTETKNKTISSRPSETKKMEHAPPARKPEGQAHLGFERPISPSLVHLREKHLNQLTGRAPPVPVDVPPPKRPVLPKAITIANMERAEKTQTTIQVQLSGNNKPEQITQGTETTVQIPPFSNKAERMPPAVRQNQEERRIDGGAKHNTNSTSTQLRAQRSIEKIALVPITLSALPAPQTSRSKGCDKVVPTNRMDEEELYPINSAAMSSLSHSVGFASSNRSRHHLESSTISSVRPGMKQKNREIQAAHFEEDWERLSFRPMHRDANRTTAESLADIFKRKEAEVERGTHVSPRASHRGKSKATQRHIEVDPMDKIAEVLREVNEAIISKVQGSFNSVTTNLEISQQAAVMRVVEQLVKMQNERAAHFNELLKATNESKEQVASILKSRRRVHLAAAQSAQCYKEIIEDHDRRSLSKKLPPKLIPKLPPTIAKFLK